MDILRRNTDYAFRLAGSLALNYGQEALPVKKLAKDNFVPYELSRKLLQMLAKADIVTSTKGPKGGFQLSRSPAEITFNQIIEAIQGKIRLNQCLLSSFSCPLKGKCPVSSHLVELQKVIDFHLSEKTLSDLLNAEKD